ncbi:MMPL family transporter [candidate division KSB1 bacterium]|nr:MMPL family transporter [candidate division KSB1 bacterium]
MKLPKLAIENHQLTSILIILLVVIGVFSFINMPKTEDPLVQPPATSIVIIYPGAGPTDIEELVIEPIEKVVNELDDIKKLQSQSRDGLCVIDVEFLTGSDPDEKYDLVVQKFNSIQSELPDEIMSTELIKWSVSDVHILQLALTSETANFRDMEREAERLQKELERVSGVRRVDIWAVPQQQVRVSINLDELAQRQLSLNRIIAAIQDANVNIPGGHVDMGTRRLSIETSGAYETVQDIRKTVVHAAGSHVVYLEDIADVSFAYEDDVYLARFNSERSIFVTVSQKPRTNIFTIFSQLEPIVRNVESTLPPSMQLHKAFDQSISVSNRVSGFFINLLQGIMLVGIVVLLAVGFRSAMIVMLAIPVSIFIALGVVDLSGFALQQMSIAGLVIALGLLVDNAIVVTENTSRFIRKGYERNEAAIRGTSQIGWAVVSSTATTVLAFIPIIMIQDVTGDFIRSMPVTVVYTLLASLLVSLTLTPYVATRVLPTGTGKKESRFQNFLDRLIEIEYRRRLTFALDHPLRVLILAAVIFTMSLGLFPLVGVSFFPKAEKPQFFINIDLPQGSNLAKTDSVATNVERLLLQKDAVKHVITNVGHGNPRLYYNVFTESQSANHAQLFIELKEYNADEQQTLIHELRSAFAIFPGAKIQVKELEQGPPVEAPVAIRLIGDQLEVLRELSIKIQDIIRRQPGTINVENPLGTTKSDLKIHINREKAAMLGVRLSDIDFSVRAAIAGVAVSEYRDEKGESYDIVVRLPIKETPGIEDIDKIYVPSMSGVLVPLRNLATVELNASPQEITHFDLQRSVLVTADVERGVSIDEVTHNVLAELKTINIPSGYRYAVAGELETRQESFGGMIQAIVAAMLAIFGVLVLQFRSYSQPLIVFSAIPLALIGSILALLITGNAFSFSAFIGLTSLVGIVVNNSIILVDYSNQLRRQGKSIREAVQKAAETRFIPIVLTTATTIGGLLPLTLGGGSLWAPMGWTIIGGLLVSTFLTLLIVPVLYSLYTRKT